jgi:hypothetical protein
MATEDTSFSNLYDFVTDKGIVIPDTDTVKTQIENAFRDKWGADINLAPETLVGRLVEGITMLIINVLGVNAMNANSFNITTAIGSWLDNIGALFDVMRSLDETDEQYRKRILNSNSRGAGFAKSIYNAIGLVKGVSHICVLDNGHQDPMTLPNSEYGVAVDAHSIYIVVVGGNDEDIARAIFNTKSLGCGYQSYLSSEYGSPVNIEIKDGLDTIGTVRFFRPDEVQLKIECDIIQYDYTGDDVELSVKNAIINYLKTRSINTIVYKEEFIAAIAQNSEGIICRDISISRKDGASLTFYDVDSIILRPSQYIDIKETDITVSIV